METLEHADPNYTKFPARRRARRPDFAIMCGMEKTKQTLDEAPHAAPNVIELTDVRKTFRDFWLRPTVKAVDGLSLSVRKGEVFGLLGPNGSGKSTILKTVIGQLPELSGAVYLDGETMRSRSRNDIARRMAILMTVRVEPELMTCRDVVSSGRYPYTGKLGVLREEDRKIVEQSLAQADALSFADSPFSAISDGQRQRILLARALCQQPQLIVLDEPTSYLDIRYKLELLSVLKRMVRENDLAVLLSLHELDLARRISDTIVCVAGDRIDRIGPPEEIFTSDYIAQLYHLERGKYDPCFSTLEFVP